MERLTDKAWRNLDPWECCGQENYCIRGCHEYGGCANGYMAPKTYKRLAEYEDTGLEPEDIMAEATPGAMVKIASQILGVQPDRLRELVKAEKDGRDTQELYRRALAIWGPDAQTLMIFEEMSELQKELCKHARGKDNWGAIADEIADVLIMPDTGNWWNRS